MANARFGPLQSKWDPPPLQPVKSSQIIQQNETEIHPLEKKMKTYVRKIKAHIAK